MRAIIPCFFFWILAIWGETYFFGKMGLIYPSLFLLFPMVLILRWRGTESYVLAIIFGLTADCFSTLPFGIYGMIFFLLAFPLRAYALQIFQQNSLTIVLTCTFFATLSNLLLYLTLDLIFGGEHWSLALMNHLFFAEILPTGLLAYPTYLAVLKFEKTLNLRLAERLF